MDQSLDIDLKEVTFSKYFTKNIASSLLNSTERLPLDSAANSSQRFSQLQININEARFLNPLNQIYKTLYSFASVSYGNHKYETQKAKNDQSNPKWNQTFTVPLHYQGQFLFPETIEIEVFTCTNLYNVSMGKSVFSFRELLAQQSQINNWVVLVDQKQITGSIFLSFQFLKSNNKSMNLEPSPSSSYNELKLQKHFYSCYEQPLYKNNMIKDKKKTLDSKRVQTFDSSLVDKLDLSQQIQFIENLVSGYNSNTQLSPNNNRSSPFGKKQHTNASTGIFKNYFQKQNQSNLSQYSDYFTEYDFSGSISNQSNLVKSSKSSYLNKKIAKLQNLIEELRNIQRLKEENHINLQRLDKTNVKNNYEINEMDTLIQNQKEELEQLEQHKQILKDEIQLNKNLTSSFLNPTSSRMNVIKKNFERNQIHTSYLVSLVENKIQKQISLDGEEILKKARMKYNLDDFTSDFYLHVKNMMKQI